MDWEIREYAILYGVLVSTFALVLHGLNIWQRWRDRERLEIWTMCSGRGSEGGKHYSYIDLCIKNCSPGAIYVENWGLKSKVGNDKLMFPQDLPIELEPFRTYRFKLCTWEMFLDDPKAMFALDGRGTKWWATKENVRKAIERAKHIDAHNKENGISQREYVHSMRD